MKRGITLVGMGTAKESIQVAMLVPESERFIEWQERNDPRGVRRLIKRLKREALGELGTCYEAGPCGYALQRALVANEIECVLVAPSLIPVKPRERIKTNRRDARHLAKSYRAGTLTEVRPPDAGYGVSSSRTRSIRCSTTASERSSMPRSGSPIWIVRFGTPRASHLRTALRSGCTSTAVARELVGFIWATLMQRETPENVKNLGRSIAA